MLVRRDNISNCVSSDVVPALVGRTSVGNCIGGFDVVGGALEPGGTGAGDALEIARHEDGCESDVQGDRITRKLIEDRRSNQGLRP